MTDSRKDWVEVAARTVTSQELQHLFPPPNPLLPPPPTRHASPEQVAGLLQDLSKQPVKESMCLIWEKRPAALHDYF